jgi:hypothetical protein
MQSGYSGNEWLRASGSGIERNGNVRHADLLQIVATGMRAKQRATVLWNMLITTARAEEWGRVHRKVHVLGYRQAKPGGL